MPSLRDQADWLGHPAPMPTETAGVWRCKSNVSEAIKPGEPTFRCLLSSYIMSSSSSRGCLRQHVRCNYDGMLSRAKVIKVSPICLPSVVVCGSRGWLWYVADGNAILQYSTCGVAWLVFSSQLLASLPPNTDTGKQS